MAGESAHGAVRELSSEMVSTLRRRVNYMLLIPAVAAEALQVARDPNVKMADLSALLERDVKLAADMLNQANSAAFLGTRTVINLRQATVKLGLEQIRQLIISSSMFSVMEKMATGEERIRQALTEHCQLTGRLCTAINRELAAGFHGEEFTAGLLHDYGRVVLATSFPQEFSQADPVDFNETPAILERERTIVGAAHTDVGAWFARQNKFPDPLIAVVQHHHDPQFAGEHTKFVALVAAADHLANALARPGGGAGGYKPDSNAAVTTLEQCGVAKARKTFAKQLPQIVAAAAT